MATLTNQSANSTTLTNDNIDLISATLKFLIDDTRFLLIDDTYSFLLGDSVNEDDVVFTTQSANSTTLTNQSSS